VIVLTTRRLDPKDMSLPMTMNGINGRGTQDGGDATGSRLAGLGLLDRARFSSGPS